MNPVTGLSLGRIVVGAAALAKPDLVAGTLGAQPQGSTMLTQWFGSREIALGAATPVARGRTRAALVAIGAAVDGADAATAYQAVQRQDVPKQIGLGLVGIASGAVVAGLLGLRVKRKTVVTAA